jgi:hypothetical protein
MSGPATGVLLVAACLAAAGCGGHDKKEGRAQKTAAAAAPSASPSPSMTPPPRPFTDETRKAIFAEAAGIEARANQEAMAANPDADSVGTSTNPDKMVRRVQKRQRVSQALQQKYRGELQARYGISEVELMAIVQEGKTKGWTAPVPQ